MHPLILGERSRPTRRQPLRQSSARGLSTTLLALSLTAGLSTSAALAAGAKACPTNTAALSEVFIAADCADCWAAARPQARPAVRPGWRLDWISPAGADAALSAAALPEAADRASRRAALGARTDAAPPPRNATWQLAVVSGPAWNGYLGVQLKLQPSTPGKPPARLPEGSTAWMALVELLPAGSEGSATDRALVRSVVGPLPLLDTQRNFQQLRALRWPETAKPERLQARAWIESPSGQVLLMAADRCPPP
jgi:hypothetical protein